MFEPTLVSVVVPTYNGGNYLEQTLRGVLGQTHRPIEIIVVDDGSSDNTVDVAQATAPNARIIRQTNARVSAARNAGLAAAVGDFVCFLDQDDVWHPQHIEKQLARFQAYPELGVVFSHFQHWHPSGAKFPDPASRWGDDQKSNPDPAFHGWIYHQFLLDCWALTSATLIRRSVLERHVSSNPSGTTPRTGIFGFDCRGRSSSRAWTGRRCCIGSTPCRDREWPALSTTGATCCWRTQRTYGLSSPDGRSLDRQRFQSTIARYQAGFGYHHLQHGSRALGVRSLWASWLREPTSLRTLALAAAGAVGWRPKPDDAETPALQRTA